VLYESHTVLHGRPYSLKGRYYANVFVHFIPIDHDEENKKDGLSGGKLAQRKKAKEEEAKASPAKVVGHEHDQHDEETLRRHRDDHDRQHGSKKREEEKEEEEEQDDDEEQEEVFEEEDGEEGEKHDGRSAIHVLAAQGDLDGIEHHVRANADIVHVRDANEWQPIHEAARGGHLDVLKYLVDLGSDIGAKTSNGGTSLWWAKKSLPKGHEVILYLESIGAPDAEDMDL
jgi:prolyl 4-hydroxylase